MAVKANVTQCDAICIASPNQAAQYLKIGAESASSPFTLKNRSRPMAELLAIVGAVGNVVAICSVFHDLYYQHFKAVEDKQRNSFEAYQREFKCFGDDLDMHRTLVDTYTTPTKRYDKDMLYVNYWNAVQHFQQALKDAYVTLERHVEFVRKTKRFPSSEAFVEAIDRAALDCMNLRLHLSRNFQVLHHSYIVFQMNKAASSGDRQSIAAAGRYVNSDALSYNFPYFPFAFHRDCSKFLTSEKLRLFNHSKDAADILHSQMSVLGTQWVDDNLADAPNVASLARIQLNIMELLWSGGLRLVRQTCQDDITRRRIDVPTAIALFGETQLVQLESKLAHQITLAKKQSFSIAFCGMVKAG